MDAVYTRPLRVGSDHPSLPGHFPGQPVVPGVLLLDCVIQAAEAWMGGPLRVTSLPQVKFLAPLLPEQEAELELSRHGADLQELRFVVRREALVVAQGALLLHAESQRN